MPAAAGPAIALETPGTTLTSMPAALQASASSLPRPKTNGSPPLSRTTVRPAPRVLHQQRVDLGLGVGRVPAAPCPHRSARRRSGLRPGARRRSAGHAPPRPHCRRSSSPRAVMRPGSPGPAPTRCTDPCLGTRAADSGPKPWRRRRRVTPGKIDDDFYESRIIPDGAGQWSRVASRESREASVCPPRRGSRHRSGTAPQRDAAVPLPPAAPRPAGHRR